MEQHSETSGGGNRATARALLPLLGGAANIASVAHCMTRLRLCLHDSSLVREAELRALSAVLGVVADGAAYQIVLGPGTAARVTSEFEGLVATARATSRTTASAAPTAPIIPSASTASTASTADGLSARGEAIRAARGARNATPVRLLLRRIAAIFVPLIPALIGCGIIAGLNGLLTNLHWLPSTAPALTALASGFMSLIAVLVGHNTAKEFGGTPVLGAAVAAVVVFPGVTQIEVLGRQLAPGQGGVLGALAAALLAAHVERWCRRWVPESLDILVTPALTVLLPGLATLYGLMYVAGEISTAIGDFANWLLSTGGSLAGLVLGGLFLPLVMLGLHQALIPLHTTLIAQQGYTVLLPFLAMAGAGQVGAAAAVHVRLRHNASLRRTIRSALPAGLLGVGEPLIYGVSLPLGRPFVTACVGGAVGGGVVGLFHQLGTAIGATAIGPSGWALFPLLAGGRGLGEAVAVYGSGLLAGYVAGFVATYCFGFTRTMLTELNAPELPYDQPGATTQSPRASSAVAESVAEDYA